MPYRPKPKKRNTKTKKWRNLREEVLATEKLCGLCFQEVEKWRNGRDDPLGPHVGHIQSVRLRPDLEFVRANVELQHRICNLKLGQ